MVRSDSGLWGRKRQDPERSKKIGKRQKIMKEMDKSKLESDSDA